MPPALVLASASPRRFQLLRDLGATFEVKPSHAEEPLPTEDDGRNPGAYVERLARIKAQSCESEGLIIAADTVVVLGEDILGKPSDHEEAIAMLTRLRGRTHTVFTGVCLRLGEREECEHVATHVTFGHVSDEFIRAYVQTGETMDKAGSYAAQGRGALLIDRMDGDYFNVVGLPLRRLSQMLTRFGISLEASW